MWLGKIFALSALCALFASSAFCAELKSGAEFLNIPVGARPVGMGNAYTALANDVTALHWNPAGLASLNQRELGAMHSQWLLNTQYNFLGFGAPTKMGTFAGSMALLSQGEEEARGAGREKIGTIKAQDQVMSLGFARGIMGIKAGAGVKLLQSQIAGFKAQTLALDLGLMRSLNSRMALGFSVQNLGPGMKFITQRDPLPLTVASGLGFSLYSGLGVALDVRHRVHTSKTEINFGTEYGLTPMLTLRGGYLAKLAGQTGAAASRLPGLSAGAGFNFANYRLDYSFVPFGLLGDTHRLSLGVRF